MDSYGNTSNHMNAHFGNNGDDQFDISDEMVIDRGSMANMHTRFDEEDFIEEELRHEANFLSNAYNDL